MVPAESVGETVGSLGVEVVVRRSDVVVRRGLALALGVGLVASALTGLASPAGAAGSTRTISGTLRTAEGGGSVGDACVRVFPPSGSGSAAVRCAPSGTGSTFAWSIAGFPPAPYEVQYTTIQGHSTRRPAWHGGATETPAAIVDLTAGDVAGVDDALVRGRSISGRITTTGSAVGLPIEVQAEGAAGAAAVQFEAAENDGSMDYTIAGLAPGSYTLMVRPWSSADSAPGKYWPGVAQASDAGSVDVTSVDASGIDVGLGVGRTISGALTAAEGGGSVAGICVKAYSWAASVYGISTSRTCAGSAAGATFNWSMSGFPAGTYKVEYDLDPTTPRSTRLPAWHGASTALASPVVDASAGDVAGVDDSLSRGRSVSGTITTTGTAVGTALTVYVTATPTPRVYTESIAAADNDGSVPYVVAGLPAGSYKLAVVPADHVASSVHWPAEPSIATAGTVDLSAVDVAGVDVALGPSAGRRTMSGTIHAAEGSGSVAGTCVTATSTASTTYPVAGAHRCAPSTAGASFAWSIDGLPSGSYKVSYYAPPGTSRLSTWHGGSTEGTATAVDLSAGDVTGIDDALERGRTVSGTITTNGDAVGKELEIDVQGSNGAAWSLIAPVDNDGSVPYTVAGLKPGSYQVLAYTFGPAPDAPAVYWPNAATSASAALVDVTSVDATGIDVTLGGEAPSNGGGGTGGGTGGGAGGGGAGGGGGGGGGGSTSSTTSTTTPQSVPAPPRPSASATASNSTPRAGEAVPISAPAVRGEAALDPKVPVVASLISAAGPRLPVGAVTVTTRDDGSTAVSVTLPTSTPPGVYLITVIGRSPSGKERVLVVPVVVRRAR